MTLRSSADEAALPPGLASEAAGLLEPGEALLWAGRGRSGATFAALWPGAAVIIVLLALLLWLMGFDGWTYRKASPALQSPIPAAVAARLALGMIVAALSWMLVQLALRVAGAPRTMVVLTSRRFLLRAGRRAVGAQLADLTRAVATGPRHRTALHFKIRKSGGTPRGLHPTLFGVANADSAIDVLGGLGVAVRDDRPERAATDEGPQRLKPGESVRWSGRRGPGAIGPERLTTAALAAPLPLPFFIAFWFAWSGVTPFSSLGGGLPWGLFMTVIACLVFGPMAWFPLSRAGPFFREWIVDAFGTLAVTDRRILFIAPLSGAIDREVPAERLDAAAVAWNSRGRGHISLTLKPESGEGNEHMELYSVPDPDNAVAAIGRLIRPR